MAPGLDGLRDRRQHGGDAQQGEARPGQARVRVGHALGERAHRRMQRRHAPHHVEGDPADLQCAAAGHVRRVQQRPPVDRVRHEQGQDRGDHEPERGGAPPDAHGKTDPGRDQQQIHRRIRHRGELLKQVGLIVVPVGSDQEHPREGADADRDDQRVDQPRPVAARVLPADDQEQAEHEAGVDRQVEDVADRRVGQRGVEEALVVVGDDVADDEQLLSKGEQVPGAPVIRLVHPDRRDDQHRGRDPDQVEQPAGVAHGEIRRRRDHGSDRIQHPGVLPHG